MYKKIIMIFCVLQSSFFVKAFVKHEQQQFYCSVCNAPLTILDVFFVENEPKPYCFACYKKLQQRGLSDDEEQREKKMYKAGRDFYELDSWQMSLKDIQKQKKHLLKRRVAKNIKKSVKKILQKPEAKKPSVSIVKLESMPTDVQEADKKPSYFCYKTKTPTGLSTELVILEYYDEEAMPEYDSVIAALPKIKQDKPVRYFCYREQMPEGLSGLKILEYFDEETLVSDEAL